MKDAVERFNNRELDMGRETVPVILSYVPPVPAHVPKPDPMPVISQARKYTEMWLYGWPVRM